MTRTSVAGAKCAASCFLGLDAETESSDPRRVAPEAGLGSQSAQWKRAPSWGTDPAHADGKSTHW